MKFSLLLIVLLVACPLMAQEETVFGGDSVDHGGYGALVTKVGRINGKYGVLAGARAGWIVNHWFALGFAGYGLVNNVATHVPGSGGEPYLSLGYGGLDMEFIDASDKVVHLSVHMLAGAGVVGFRNSLFARDRRDRYDGWGDGPGGEGNGHPRHCHGMYGTSGPNAADTTINRGRSHYHDVFFVFEPGANIDINLTSWFRLGLGASYRMVSGVRPLGTTNKDLTGASAMVTLRFGSF